MWKTLVTIRELPSLQPLLLNEIEKVMPKAQTLYLEEAWAIYEVEQPKDICEIDPTYFDFLIGGPFKKKLKRAYSFFHRPFFLVS